MGRLQLHALACYSGNFSPHAGDAEAITDWSMTTLYVALQMGKVDNPGSLGKGVSRERETRRF
jgi:hypothetical protein